MSTIDTGGFLKELKFVMDKYYVSLTYVDLSNGLNTVGILTKVEW